MLSEEFNLHARLEDYHWWFRARREIILEVLKDYVPAKADRLVAEIGCGTGGNLKFLQGHYRVIGVDVSPDATRYAAQRVDCPILLGDFRETLSDRWEHIDGVLCADVLEHVQDDKTFLRDLLARMKRGGILLVTVPAHQFLWSRHDEILGHYRRYSARQLRELWHNLPAEELFVSPFNCILFPLIFLRRTLFKSSAETGIQTDLHQTPRYINTPLYALFSAEKLVIRHHALPFGVSYLAVLRKK